MIEVTPYLPPSDPYEEAELLPPSVYGSYTDQQPDVPSCGQVVEAQGSDNDQFHQAS